MKVILGGRNWTSLVVVVGGAAVVLGAGSILYLLGVVVDGTGIDMISCRYRVHEHAPCEHGGVFDHTVSGLMAAVVVAWSGMIAAVGVYVERRKYGRYWLVFSMKHGSKREEFFMVGSHHVNNPSPPYLDLCCGAQVLHLHPYEKRRAHTCKQTWGRRSRNGIDQSNSAAFYEEAARAINLTLPTPALVETHPSQPLLGGP